MVTLQILFHDGVVLQVGSSARAEVRIDKLLGLLRRTVELASFPANFDTGVL